MVITVTDANIFIDLIKLEMLGYLFGANLTIHTTGEIIDQLNEYQQQIIIAFIHSRTLNVTYFTADEIEIIHSTNYPKSLEFPDKTVFFLAKSLNCHVLTGDAPLRKFCTSQNITVKGILWLFDRFIEEELINYHLAISKMEYLMSFNTRLPKDDCIERLTNWKNRALKM